MYKDYSPLKVFKFCPRCGSLNLHVKTERSMECPDCGLHWYFNMASAVAGLIFNADGKLLMTIRAGEPAKGSLDLPGGFVDMGETAQQALQREILEELQIDAEVGEFIGSFPNQYLFGGVLYETLDLVFRCNVKDFSTLLAGDDVAGIRFVDINTMDLNTIGLNSIREIVASLRDQ